MHLTLGLWDVVLVGVVAVQATALAYLPHPQWKALVLTLPLPFTAASLALGQRPDITHLLGLVLLLLYTHGVRLLHYRLHLAIQPAIVLSALGYCLAASLLAPRLPRDEAAFWLASLLVAGLGLGLYRALPRRAEPGQRSLLPVWLKLPLVALVVLGLVALKGVLQGFMGFFPMVGVIAAYEARRSLWTIGRQIPALMVCMVPLITLSHLTQPALGTGASLAVGWLAYLAVFLPLARRQWPAPVPALTGLTDGSGVGSA